MTMIHEAPAQKTFHVTSIYDSRLVWLTHEKPIPDQNGVLVFVDSCGNEITVPQSAVWIEDRRSKH